MGFHSWSSPLKFPSCWRCVIGSLYWRGARLLKASPNPKQLSIDSCALRQASKKAPANRIGSVRRVKSRPTNLSELAWLADVKESTQPLSEQFPVWVRHGMVYSGPTIPHPERHPYCELSTVMQGSVIGFVGRENAERWAGDYFLAGPEWLIGFGPRATPFVLPRSTFYPAC